MTLKRKLTHHDKLNQCGLVLRYGVLAGCCLLGLFGIFAMAFSIFSLLYGINFASTVMGTSLVANATSSLIVSSCLVFISTFLGCLAILYNSKTALLTYVIILSLAFLLSIVSGVLAIVFRTWISDQIRTHMRATLQNKYGIEGNERITQNWDEAQQKWYCCAVEDRSWGIYRSSEWYNNQTGIPEYDKPWVPITCCAKNQYGIYINVMKCQNYNSGPPGLQSGLPNEALFYQGCFEAGSALLYKKAATIIGVAFGFCLILIAEVYFATWFFLII